MEFYGVLLSGYGGMGRSGANALGIFGLVRMGKLKLEKYVCMKKHGYYCTLPSWKIGQEAAMEKRYTLTEGMCTKAWDYEKLGALWISEIGRNIATEKQFIARNRRSFFGN
jgi:hypothetical protein